VNRLARGSSAILWKEVSLEWKTRETAGSMVVFAVLVLVLFHFAFETRLLVGLEPVLRETLPPGSADAVLQRILYRFRGMESDVGRILPGVYWVAVAFAAVLGLNRSYARDAEGRVIEGQLVSPVPAEAVFLGKAAANSLLIVVTGAVLIPLVAVLFNQPVGHAWPRLLAVLLAAGFGTGVIGTLFSSVAGSTRLREVMLPILMLPVVAPILIWAVQATAVALGARGDFWTPVVLILGQSAVFLIASLFLYEYLLEE